MLAAEPAGARRQPLAVRRAFSVNSGFTTFYLNGVMTVGASAGDEVRRVLLTVEFRPTSSLF